jgi:hypothetical protein
MVWKPTTYKVISIKRPFESFREEPKKNKKRHSSPSLRLATTPRPRSRDGMGKQVVSNNIPTTNIIDESLFNRTTRRGEHTSTYVTR